MDYDLPDGGRPAASVISAPIPQYQAINGATVRVGATCDASFTRLSRTNMNEKQMSDVEV